MNTSYEYTWIFLLFNSWYFPQDKWLEYVQKVIWLFYDKWYEDNTQRVREEKLQNFKGK